MRNLLLPRSGKRPFSGTRQRDGRLAFEVRLHRRQQVSRRFGIPC
nr:MAG TPA: hypothetical protein [Caudoviricetes sp.]